MRLVENIQMITTILSDFSRVILNPKDSSFTGKLNQLNLELTEKYGDYVFEDYFVFNDELLDLYTELKTRYSVNIFTTGTIQNHPEVRKRIDPIFDHIYTAKDFNLNKRSQEAYIFIAHKLKKTPQKILFIDDTQANLDAASAAGMQTVQYISPQDLRRHLQTLAIL